MSNLQQEDSDSPRVSLSPSRKRSRVVDSDDETDYSCQTPDSFSPCPSPKKILMTPPMKRKTAHGTISDVPIVPFTPSTACKKLKVWQRYEVINLYLAKYLYLLDILETPTS